MKIVTYNVNGVRAAIEKGLIEWLDENSFDVVCLQETKAHMGSVPVLLFESLGYRHIWHSAKRKGYSGVATFVKTTPDFVEKGMGVAKFDDEGRVLRTDLGDLTILNCYFPNGGSGPERHQYKMQFLGEIYTYVQRLMPERPNLVIVGDYNIAHHELDLDENSRQSCPSGFRDEEREWLTKWFEAGLVDAYRFLHPSEVSFTWWSMRHGARRRNEGWRIDYLSVSNSIADRIDSVTHMHEARHSDHCPVLLEIDTD